jgi:hypothetical protein
MADKTSEKKAPSEAETAAKVRQLLDEGRKLREAIDARVATMHVLTADDLKTRSR